MRKQKPEEKEHIKKSRPALTPEAQENRLIALAMNLVEERLKNGTATSQETTSIIRWASAKERLEREKLEKENELLKAKAEVLRSAKKTEEKYEAAIAAMKRYSGHGDREDDDY